MSGLLPGAGSSERSHRKMHAGFHVGLSPPLGGHQGVQLSGHLVKVCLTL